MASSRQDDQLLTVQDVAEQLRVHPITVRRHIKSGRLPAVRAGRSMRVRASDLGAFLRPEIAPGIRLPYRWPPTPEETEQRRKIVQEMRKRRAKMKPLGISTSELVRQPPAAREWIYED